MPDIDPNNEAIVNAIRTVGRKSLIFGGIILVGTIAFGMMGGTAAAMNGTPGWGALFFMYEGMRSLAVAIPIALCVYIGVTLLSGLVAFLYFRFFKK